MNVRLQTYQDVEAANPERLLQVGEELKLLDGRTSPNCPTTHHQYGPSPSRTTVGALAGNALWKSVVSTDLDTN